MSANSDTILELLRETDAVLSKRGIEVNLRARGFEMPYDTLKKQVELLADYGLLEVEEERGAWYSLSDAGEAYLDGDLDANELVA